MGGSFFVSVHQNGPFRGQKHVFGLSVHENPCFGGQNVGIGVYCRDKINEVVILIWPPFLLWGKLLSLSGNME